MNLPVHTAVLSYSTSNPFGFIQQLNELHGQLLAVFSSDTFSQEKKYHATGNTTLHTWHQLLYFSMGPQ
jgi:hypothetical protein